MAWYDPRDWFQKSWTGNTRAEEQARGDALDAKLAELNQQKLDAGTWNLEQYQAAERNRINGMIDVAGEMNQAYAAGAREGWENTKAAVSSAGTFVIREALRAIPWWLWLGGLIYLAIALGWHRWLLGKAKAPV